MKRLIERPWATKRNGSWIYRTSSLVESLKKAKVADLNGKKVGTQELVRILRLFPGEYCKVSVNGDILIETVALTYKGEYVNRKVSYRKPKHYFNQLKLFDGAWVPKYQEYQVVIIKPRKF